jgi:hypothetical protein
MTRYSRPKQIRWAVYLRGELLGHVYNARNSAHSSLLGGDECEAVELFPAESRRSDGRGSYDPARHRPDHRADVARAPLITPPERPGRRFLP